MTRLTGSTKQSDWARRWGHELPRDWERGRIQVEGDEGVRFYRGLLVTLVIAGMMWAAVVCWWA